MSQTLAKSCFVISPIGDADSDTRKRADLVFQLIIEPTVKAAGYSTVQRADMLAKSGQITSQIIERILHDDLVVADLTDGNPNVYYELAIRHAIRKPYIHIIQHDQKLPFDVSITRTILLDHTDLWSAERCKNELRNYMKGFEDGEEIDSPISTALTLEALRVSTNPVAQTQKELIARLESIEQTLAQGLSKSERTLTERLGSVAELSTNQLYTLINRLEELVDEINQTKSGNYVEIAGKLVAVVYVVDSMLPNTPKNEFRMKKLRNFADDYIPF